MRDILNPAGPRLAAGLLVAASLAAAPAALAAQQAYSGSFSDPGNTALVSSTLGTADFTDANAFADNVALYAFTVPVAETVTFTSSGFAAGGADPYFSLFSGSGGFLLSNFAQASSTGGDFSLSSALAAGQYEFALGVNQNMSFAENLGNGALADGFIGLGDPSKLGNARYALTLAMPVAAVPEPATWELLAAGLVAVVAVARRRQPAA